MLRKTTEAKRSFPKQKSQHVEHENHEHYCLSWLLQLRVLKKNVLNVFFNYYYK